MLLPNREKAHVPERKLTSYLLSSTHPVGKSKARFFNLHGFTTENAELLEHRLLKIAREGTIQETEHTPRGTKYVIEGSIGTPQGYTIEVRTIWIIEINRQHPRLVTAYPA